MQRTEGLYTGTSYRRTTNSSSSWLSVTSNEDTEAHTKEQSSYAGFAGASSTTVSLLYSLIPSSYSRPLQKTEEPSHKIKHPSRYPGCTVPAVCQISKPYIHKSHLRCADDGGPSQCCRHCQVGDRKACDDSENVS